MKKITSIILSVILFFSVSTTSISAESDKSSDMDGIISALNAVEPVKDRPDSGITLTLRAAACRYWIP